MLCVFRFIWACRFPRIIKLSPMSKWKMLKALECTFHYANMTFHGKSISKAPTSPVEKAENKHFPPFCEICFPWKSTASLLLRLTLRELFQSKRVSFNLSRSRRSLTFPFSHEIEWQRRNSKFQCWTLQMMSGGENFPLWIYRHNWGNFIRHSRQPPSHSTRRWQEEE